MILLAGGEGRRMRGEDKLLREVEGEAVLRYSARAALGSRANRVRVVVPEAETARRDTLAGLDVDIIETPETSLGMAASLQAGLRAIEPTTHAVIVALADMPEVTAEHHDRLIAAFRPDEQREICRACDEGGFPGHPVLFGARFFEALRALQGDRGAKEILIAHPEYLQEVATPGRGATLDLDSPEDWAAWDAERKTRAAS
nr:nucleotidyltransferase family protein [Poseidonocella pacifica]